MGQRTFFWRKSLGFPKAKHTLLLRPQRLIMHTLVLPEFLGFVPMCKLKVANKKCMGR